MITTFRVLRTPAIVPVALLQAVITSILGFAESFRLGIEVAREIDNANQLSPRGRMLLGIQTEV